MKRHPLSLLAATALLVTGCTSGPRQNATATAPQAATAPVATKTTPQPTTESSAPAEPTADTYALHHRVFPNLLFQTEGKFFASLHEGDFNALREVVAKNYGEAYARAMRFKSVSSPDIVFVTFAEPSRAPLCYHLALIKIGDEHKFLTLERSEDIFSTGIKSAFCGWSADGKHMNFGPRSYTSLKEFEDEVVKFAENKTSPQPAAITTPGK